MACAALLTGCPGSKPNIVLYSDVDQSVAQPLVEQFKQDRQIDVQVVYADPKTVGNGAGLSDRIRDESESPKADIYWAGGPQAAQKLADLGLLDQGMNSYATATAAAFSGPNGLWAGLGGRARVLIYNTRAYQGKKPPLSIAALGAANAKGRVAWADPRKNGSANYHLLTYFAAYGEDDGKRLVQKMKDNAVQLLPDENAVAEAVASGAADWGVTDSDVATRAVTAKKPVDYLVPDQDDFSTSDALGQMRGAGVPTLGTPALPFPLCICARHPSPDAVALHDFLLAPAAALRISQARPDWLMTRAGADTDKPGKEAGHLVHADKLRFTSLGMDKLKETRAQLTLALSHILDDAP